MSAKLTLDGNSQGATKAVLDFNKALDQTENEAEGAAKASKRMLDQVQRIKESLDPQAKYNRKIQDLIPLVKNGALEINDAREMAKRYGLALERAGESANKAFDIRDIGRFVGSLQIAQTAAAGLRDMLKAVNDERRNAAEKVVGSLSGFGELAQVATDEASFKRMKELGYGLIESGAIHKDNQAGAASLAFQFESAGFNRKDSAFMQKLAASMVVAEADLPALVGAVGQAQKAYGMEESGSAQDQVNKAIAAAAPTKARAQDMAAAAAKLGTAAQTLGLSDEEVYGSLSKVTAVVGSSSEAETRIKALYSAIDAKGLDKETFAATIAGINERVAGGKSARTILGGSQEALEAYGLLSNVDQLQASISAVDDAQRSDPVTQKMNYVDSDPLLKAAKQKRQQEGKLAVTTMRAAEGQLLLDSVLAGQAEQMRRESPGWLSEAMIWADSQIQDKVPFITPESTLNSLEGNGMLKGLDRQLQKDVHEFNRRQAEAAERTANATEHLLGKSKSRIATRAE